jgi:hypothetical protein
LARPEALAFADPADEAALSGEVRDLRFAGSVYVYTVAVEGGELEIQAGADQARLGDVVAVAPRSAPTGLFAFAVRSEGQDS